MTVRVVVDSSAGLPAEVVRELDITVADMHVVETGEEKGTSGLSSLELAACYARQLERGGDDGVVALHLSKALSSTWSAAVAASAVFPGTVRVVETDAAGMSVGAAAMAAATVAREGSLSGAARTLGLTPSAVSQRARAAAVEESDAGMRLAARLMDAARARSAEGRRRSRADML